MPRRHDSRSADGLRQNVTTGAKPRRPFGRRRGAAIVSFVAAMMIIGALTLWVFHLSATTNTAFLGHYYGTCGLYAAESALEMALYEKNVGEPNQIDSSGSDGSISDDGSAANDPLLETGGFYARPDPGGTPDVYQAIGRPSPSTAPWSGFRRVIEYRVQ